MHINLIYCYCHSCGNEWSSESTDKFSHNYYWFVVTNKPTTHLQTRRSFSGFVRILAFSLSNAIEQLHRNSICCENCISILNLNSLRWRGNPPKKESRLPSIVFIGNENLSVLLYIYTSIYKYPEPFKSQLFEIHECGPNKSIYSCSVQEKIKLLTCLNWMWTTTTTATTTMVKVTVFCHNIYVFITKPFKHKTNMQNIKCNCNTAEWTEIRALNLSKHLKEKKKSNNFFLFLSVFSYIDTL